MKRNWILVALLATIIGLTAAATAQAQRADSEGRPGRENAEERERSADEDERRRDERERDTERRREEMERRREETERARERRQEDRERRDAWERRPDRDRRGDAVRGRWDRDRDGRWDVDVDWSDIVDGVLRGDRRDGYYRFRTPWGFDLDLNLRDDDGRRPDWYDRGRSDRDRWYRGYPHRWDGRRSWDRRGDGGSQAWLAYQLALHADRLLGAVRRADFRYEDREMTVRAELFARAADRLYEDYRRGDDSPHTWRLVTRRWQDLDEQISRISPHRHREVQELAREVDRLYFRLRPYASGIRR